MIRLKTVKTFLNAENKKKIIFFFKFYVYAFGNELAKNKLLIADILNKFFKVVSNTCRKRKKKIRLLLAFGMLSRNINQIKKKKNKIKGKKNIQGKRPEDHQTEFR